MSQATELRDELHKLKVAQAQQGAARLTVNSGNATDPQISAMNRTMAVNSVVQQRFDGLYSADPIKAGNWLLNGKTADGTPVRNLVSGPAGDQLIERAQGAQDKGFVDGLFQKYIGGGSGAAPSQPGTPFTPKALPPGVTLNEDAMVRTVAGEAGAEPLKGQQAVAAVIMNRANGSGASPRDVVFAPNQFEPWNGGAARQRLEAMDPSSAQYQSILNNVVRPVMSGQVADPTGGATHFYAPVAQAALGRAAPSWATGTPTVIGGHNFYTVGYTPGSAAPAPIGTAPTPDQNAPAPALAAMPDESAMVNDVIKSYPPGPRRDRLVADVRGQMSQLNLSIKTDRDDFVHTLPDLQSALLAGEMSGHTFFKERWYGFDDGLYTGARLLEILSRSANASAVLEGLPQGVSTPELKIEMKEGEPHAVIERLQREAKFAGSTELITIDGVRAEYADGFGLARASNTTPVIVLRFEGDTPEALARIQDAFRAELKLLAPHAHLPF